MELGKSLVSGLKVSDPNLGTATVNGLLDLGLTLGDARGLMRQLAEGVWDKDGPIAAVQWADALQYDELREVGRAVVSEQLGEEDITSAAEWIHVLNDERSNEDRQALFNRFSTEFPYIDAPKLKDGTTLEGAATDRSVDIRELSRKTIDQGLTVFITTLII